MKPERRWFFYFHHGAPHLRLSASPVSGGLILFQVTLLNLTLIGLTITCGRWKPPVREFDIGVYLELFGGYVELSWQHETIAEEEEL